MKKIIIIFFLIVSFVEAKDKLFLLPQDKKEAKDNIIKLIQSSQNEIKIAMYNFNYKKFSKELINATKRGVDIKVVFDKSKILKNDKLYKEFKKSNIKVAIADKKLHTKVAIFDSKKIVYGSANWKKESFKDNYELIIISDNKKHIKRISSFIENF